MERVAFKIQSISCLFQYRECLENNLKVRKDVKQKEMSQKKFFLNYLKITTGRKPENNWTRTGKDYTNGSLRSVSGIAVLTIKSINSSTKVKTLKKSFLTNCQTIYPTSLEINCNNSLLFQYTIIARLIH